MFNIKAKASAYYLRNSQRSLVSRIESMKATAAKSFARRDHLVATEKQIQKQWADS